MKGLQRCSNPAAQNWSYNSIADGTVSHDARIEPFRLCPNAPDGNGNNPPGMGKCSECLIVLKMQIHLKKRKKRATCLPSH